MIFVAFLLAIAYVITQMYFPHWIEHPLPLFDGPRGFVVYVDPLQGWWLAFPETWHSEQSAHRARWAGEVEYSGIRISNIKGGFPESPLTAPINSKLVAVAVGYAAGPIFGISCYVDTELPLTLKSFTLDENERLVDDSGGRVRLLSKRFSMSGLSPYSVTVWSGSQASPTDIQKAESTVGSIDDRPGKLPSGSHDCSKGVPSL